MTDTLAAKEPKGVFVKTWGCQMNTYDSNRMVDVLRPLGYLPVDSAKAADLVILNTCHIREKASEKLFSELGRLRNRRKQAGKASGDDKQIFAVAGCVAQAEGAQIMRRAPEVDLVFGPQTYHLLPELVARASGGHRPVNTDFPVEDKFDSLPQPEHRAGGARNPSAYLAIQEGCDKFCTYCVVPYTRGAEYSRPPSQIIAEATALAAQGVRELTLLGQNVNAYRVDDGKNSTDFAALLYSLAEIPGIARLRYTTSHPRELTDSLIAAHRDLPQLMPFLHLPVQSGSDKILAAMNRKHDRALYLRAIEKLRAAQPELAFSSDFITGFPGETDADHRDTMRLVGDVGYALAFSFKFSRRTGTPAATMPGQLREEVKDERLYELQALLFQQQTAFNQSCVGRTVDVLFDRPGKVAGQILGRSPWLQSVYVAGSHDLIGQIHPVHITAATQNSLAGSLISNPQESA